MIRRSQDEMKLTRETVAVGYPQRYLSDSDESQLQDWGGGMKDRVWIPGLSSWPAAVGTWSVVASTRNGIQAQPCCIRMVFSLFFLYAFHCVLDYLLVMRITKDDVEGITRIYISVNKVTLSNQVL
ncbi:hypothetical protein RUM43_008487 [Polyplax serrata]|uniref:Uncharacterized protein n=1 Tax=Polyplax serrata TaxID=468196 RepID=A0AAN8NMP4_POLSC